MEKVWNDFSLKKPPFLTVPAKYSHSIQELHEAIDDYISKQCKLEPEFDETAALLSRLLARRKNSFNKMKGFKDVCKLNSALCRLLRIDFKRDLESFRNALPDVDYAEGTITQMPTRECFDFVLMRLISINELHRRIGDCSASAAKYFSCQIRMCFFFEINTMFLAVLAKIHSISIKLLNLAVDLYNNCFLYRLKLPINPKSKFLKDCEFEFPDQLETIKLSVIEKDIYVEPRPLKNLSQQEEKSTAVKAKKLKKTDVGQEVIRPSIPAQKSLDMVQINSVDDIKLFIAMESKSRKTNLKDSITAKIQSYEWAGATNLFQRKVQSGEEKKAVTIFRKFLSLKVV